MFLALTEFLGEGFSEFLPAYYLCATSELTEFFAELTEFAAKLSEFSLLKQFSRAGLTGLSTEVVSMKRPNFLNFKASYTVVSKRNFQIMDAPSVETLLVLADILEIVVRLLPNLLGSGKSPLLSAASPGDDLRLESAIRLQPIFCLNVSRKALWGPPTQGVRKPQMRQKQNVNVPESSSIFKSKLYTSPK